MTVTEAVHAAREAAEHYRSTGRLTDPAPVDTRLVVDVVKIDYLPHPETFALARRVPVVYVRARRPTLTAQATSWLENNPEE